MRTDLDFLKLARVHELDALRVKKGFKPGWTYYRCKEEGLLSELDYLERHGRRRHCTGTPLAVELVPETCWFSNVRSNVTAEDWARLKKATARKARYRCEICGGRGPEWPVECHEVWHYDEETKVQRLERLIALCPACHEAKHIGLAGERGRDHIAAAHLAFVNGWTPEEAEDHIEEQFELWEKRSSHEWTLDLSWLKQFGIEPKNQERAAVPLSTIESAEGADSALVVRRLNVRFLLFLVALLSTIVYLTYHFSRP